ncbi:DUF998 domain-containing protein [Phreatobacter stygius]|uniref:DUF998 domain-containing protein n=1 Tax=Phreatobacter stygius TaxID=1940610 RepID=A0A4D7B294_9HYPH|nr:DUF998 domain-containing protein [Phreatobacter stygius]QCI64180.1 DUF998 domain-containing protein [Phreatobacter stygius]
MTRDHQAADRALLRAGLAAGAIFFTVPTIEIFIRPGFDLARHAISMLSLGERGWLMTATFIVTGLLTILSAIGMRRILVGDRLGTWGAGLIGVYGAGMVAAGLFPAQAGMGFPPGTPDDLMPDMTTPVAILHGLAFMVGFAALIAACFVFARRFVKIDARGWATFSAAAGVAIPLFIIIGMSGIVAAGIAIYFGGMLAWCWLAAIVLRLSQENQGISALRAG